MTCYSIGYMREDGKFAILATLNNNDDVLWKALFEKLKISNERFLSIATGKEIISIERQDVPDTVELKND